MSCTVSWKALSGEQTIYVDCLVVNVRENQRVINKALYLVLLEAVAQLVQGEEEKERAL